MGIYDTEVEAARAWDAAAAHYRGEVENLNFPAASVPAVPSPLRRRLGAPPAAQHGALLSRDRVEVRMLPAPTCSSRSAALLHHNSLAQLKLKQRTYRSGQ